MTKTRNQLATLAQLSPSKKSNYEMEKSFSSTQLFSLIYAYLIRCEPFVTKKA